MTNPSTSRSTGTSAEPGRILLVDDEQPVLDALRRQHRRAFDLDTACGPEDGLAALAADGPYAVVVSDFKMPGMNGVEFLRRVQEQSPDTVRVMLTGQANLETASRAVNEGNIFRFLTKPCEPDTFAAALSASLQQYELVHAERILLEHTVKGCVEVLSEVLALSNPMAFGRASRVRGLVAHVSRELELHDAWQYETAALLSQIGFVAIPDDLLLRAAGDDELSDDERTMLDGHAGVARDLLAKIPRLQTIAEIVFHQDGDRARALKAGRGVLLGSQILAAALGLEELLSSGIPLEEALEATRTSPRRFSPKIVDALASAATVDSDLGTMQVAVHALRTGMILDQSIHHRDGLLIVPKGHEVTDSSLGRLRNYSGLGLLALKEVRVRRKYRDDASAEEAA
ncbi:MAG: HD domain-containing phosphohydrolase [Planctomycetota bacterium]